MKSKSKKSGKKEKKQNTGCVTVVPVIAAADVSEDEIAINGGSDGYEEEHPSENPVEKMLREDPAFEEMRSAKQLLTDAEGRCKRMANLISVAVEELASVNRGVENACDTFMECMTNMIMAKKEQEEQKQQKQKQLKEQEIQLKQLQDKLLKQEQNKKEQLKEQEIQLKQLQDLQQEVQEQRQLKEEVKQLNQQLNEQKQKQLIKEEKHLKQLQELRQDLQQELQKQKQQKEEMKQVKEQIKQLKERTEQIQQQHDQKNQQQQQQEQKNQQQQQEQNQKQPIEQENRLKKLLEPLIWHEERKQQLQQQQQEIRLSRQSDSTPCTDDSMQTAKKIAASMIRAKNMVRIKMSAIDCLATGADIVEAIKERIGITIPPPPVQLHKNGWGTAVFSVPRAKGDELVSKGRLKVLDIPSKLKIVDPLTKELLRCGRCLERGHIAKKCTGVDRSNLCLQCAQPGHSSTTCKEFPKCILCGKEHRMGARTCSFSVGAT